MTIFKIERDSRYLMLDDANGFNAPSSITVMRMVLMLHRHDDF